MFTESLEFAPEWLKNVAMSIKSDASVVAIFRLHPNYDASKYPMLRDRTDEVSKQVRGMLGDLDAELEFMQTTGGELYRNFDYPAVGAQFAQDFMIIVG